MDKRFELALDEDTSKSSIKPDLVNRNMESQLVALLGQFLDQQAELIHSQSVKLKQFVEDNSLTSSEGPKKKRREKKPKKIVDPNEPKKPLSAYLLFLADETPTLKREHPEMVQKEIMRTLGNKWTHGSDATKADYNRKADALKAEYASEMEAYKRQKSAEEFHVSDESAAESDGGHSGSESESDDDEDSGSDTLPVPTARVVPANNKSKPAAKAPAPVPPPSSPSKTGGEKRKAETEATGAGAKPKQSKPAAPAPAPAASGPPKVKATAAPAPAPAPAAAAAEGDKDKKKKDHKKDKKHGLEPATPEKSHAAGGDAAGTEEKKKVSSLF